MTRPVVLHRGVPRIPLSHMAHHDPDALYQRFNGKQRSYRIEPPVPWVEWLFVCVVAAAIGAMMVAL